MQVMHAPTTAGSSYKGQLAYDPRDTVVHSVYYTLSQCVHTVYCVHSVCYTVLHTVYHTVLQTVYYTVLQF